MATPITWRNVGSTVGDSTARLMQGASESGNRAAKNLQSSLSQYQQNEDDRVDRTIQEQSDSLQADLRGFNSNESFADPAKRAEMENKYAGTLGTSRVNDIFATAQADSQQRETDAYNYQSTLQQRETDAYNYQISLQERETDAYNYQSTIQKREDKANLSTAQDRVTTMVNDPNMTQEDVNTGLNKAAKEFNLKGQEYIDYVSNGQKQFQSVTGLTERQQFNIETKVNKQVSAAYDQDTTDANGGKIKGINSLTKDIAQNDKLYGINDKEKYFWDDSASVQNVVKLMNNENRGDSINYLGDSYGSEDGLTDQVNDLFNSKGDLWELSTPLDKDTDGPLLLQAYQTVGLNKDGMVDMEDLTTEINSIRDRYVLVKQYQKTSGDAKSKLQAMIKERATVLKGGMYDEKQAYRKFVRLGK
jgi:hypothetical protein